MTTWKVYEQKTPNFTKYFFPEITSPGVADNGKNIYYPVGCFEIPNINNGDLIQVKFFLGLNAETFTKAYLNSTSFLCIHNKPVLESSDKLTGKSIGPTCAENMAGRTIEPGVVYRIKDNSYDFIVDSSTYRPLYLIHYILVRSTQAKKEDYVKYAGLRKDGTISNSYYLLQATHFSN